jgi:hypothetical protein
MTTAAEPFSTTQPLLLSFCHSAGNLHQPPTAPSLVHLESDDKVASATVIPPEDPKTKGENGTLVQ